MCGGPLYRFYLSTKMGREPLALLGRRLIVVSLIAWLPLLILSAITGALIGGPVRVPFLYDIEVHIKYLLSLPLLIAAEMPVHRHLLPIKRMFVERGLISSEDRPRYERIFASATRLCYSGRVELLLLVVVYAIGHPLWIREIELPIATWYASPSAEGLRLTLPGYWYAFVSAPLLQFLFLRWYVRLFVWARLLWQVSRLNLHLIPAHPDRKGGLGFLEESVMGFALFLLAEGVGLAAPIADDVFYEGLQLVNFEWVLAGVILLLPVIVLSPLAFFAGKLFRAKSEGLDEYGNLASRYAEEFDQKRIRGGAPEAEPLLGNADFKSLSGMITIIRGIEETQLIPCGKETLIQLVVITALPFVPLMMTFFPMKEVLVKFLEMLI